MNSKYLVKPWVANISIRFSVTVICPSAELTWSPTRGWMATFLCSEVRKSQNTPLSWNSSQFNYWADKYYSHRLDFKNNFIPGYNSGCGVENWTNYKNSLIFLTTTLVCRNKKGKKNKRTFWTHLNLRSWFDEESLFSFSSSTFCHIYSCLSSTSLKLNIQYLH